MTAIRIYEETLPCGHQQIIKLFSSIVNAQIANAKFDDALKFCETKLNEYEQFFKTGHPSVGKMQQILGDIAI